MRRSRSCVAILLSAATLASTSASGAVGGHTITTVAKLTVVPRGWHDLALDAKGNAYVVAGQDNHEVFKVSPSGSVSLFAGTTKAVGFGTGDGGPAKAANLVEPTFLAVDMSGNVYIGSDLGGVRKVGTDGKITTVVGATGTTFTDGGPAAQQSVSEVSGMGFDQQGNLFLSCTPAGSDARVLAKVSPNGVITVVHNAGLTRAGEMLMRGLAVDRKGNLYFATAFGTQSSIKVLAPGGAVKTVLTTPGTDPLAALTTDRDGNLYYARVGYPQIYRLTPGGAPTVVAGAGEPGSEAFAGDGGPALKALLGFPNGLAVDANGNVYFEDGGNQRVRKIGNALPMPSLKADPTSGTPPLAVSLDASASRDPDGSIATYAWEFGDGKTATGQTAQHTYMRPGTYAVKLTVSDDSGAMRVVTRSIDVTAR